MLGTAKGSFGIIIRVVYSLFIHFHRLLQTSVLSMEFVGHWWMPGITNDVISVPIESNKKYYHLFFYWRTTFYVFNQKSLRWVIGKVCKEMVSLKFKTLKAVGSSTPSELPPFTYAQLLQILFFKCLLISIILVGLCNLSQQ